MAHLVHPGHGPILDAYVLIACSFDDAVVTRLDRKRLPRTWRSYPAPPELQLIGDEWVRSGASAVLGVPSAVIHTESNYLLNPGIGTFRRSASLRRSHSSSTSGCSTP